MRKKAEAENLEDLLDILPDSSLIPNMLDVMAG